jgi:hypothetical protein
MNAASPSCDVAPVLHFWHMPEDKRDPQDVRRTRLKLFADKRDLHGPTELGAAIGRKANQTSDLLHGRARFGEKLARDIEIAADLPIGWLDGLSTWPFSDELEEAVQELARPAIHQLENVMRAHLNMPPLAAAPVLQQVHTPAPPAGMLPAPLSVQDELARYTGKNQKVTKRRANPSK